MDKRIQDVKTYVTDQKNRATVVTVAAGIAVVAGIIAFIAKRGGKAKQ